MQTTMWCPTCGRRVDAWRQDRRLAPWVIGGFFLPVLWAVALYEGVRDLGPWHCPACGRVLPEPDLWAAPGRPGQGSNGLAGQAGRAAGRLPRWAVWTVLGAAAGVGLLINGCIVWRLVYALVSR